MTQLLNRFLIRLQADYRVSSVSIDIDNAAGCAAAAATRIAATTPTTPTAKTATTTGTTTALLQQRLSSPTSVIECPHFDRSHTFEQDHKEVETLAQHKPSNQLQGLPPLSNMNEVPCTASSTCCTSDETYEPSPYMKLLMEEHDCRPQGVQIVVDRTAFSPPQPKCKQIQPSTVSHTSTRTSSRRHQYQLEQISKGSTTASDDRSSLDVGSRPPSILKSETSEAGAKGKGGVPTMPITLDDVVDPHSRRRASPVPRTA